MKRRLIVGAALVACMVGLTLTSGLAQAQSTSASLENEGEAEEADKDEIVPEVGPGEVAGTCTIGPRGGDTTFTCFNLGGFIAVSPRTVHCQTRNNPFQPINFPDQFAVQILQTGPQLNGFVRYRIRRLDIPGAGWGQNLRVGCLIVNF